MKRGIAIFACAVLLFYNAPLSFAFAPCTGEAADVCGFLPSTYGDLGIGGVPALCDAECTLDGGYDRCGVCGGAADFFNELLEPLGLQSGARVGGSVANWNGTVAASQHIGQELAPIVSVPITTWNLDHATGTYELYELPWAIGDSAGDDTKVPVGRGYALIMSENYLVVGSHDTQPRVAQLWTRTPEEAAPWSHAWTTIEFCANNHFGYSVAVDERIPTDSDDGLLGTVAVGDPGAEFSGRVAIYMTYSPAILQVLNYGTGNETETACFGRSVSADSGLLAVGAPSLDYASFTDAGNVFIYKWNPAASFQGEYEFLVTITPPIPEENGGFGESVSVWDSWVMVGDNQFNVYLYKIVGAVAVPLVFENPLGTNLISRLGYSVSIWDQYAVAGDENYIVSPSARGATFVWNDNPLDPNLYRYMYRLNDEPGSFNTRFGAYVDVRGGCYVASGAPAEGNLGAVWVTNLCREDCFGCDGVLNSCQDFDECGICGGNNSTCIDCLGVLFGSAELDGCGVCQGGNTTCVNAFANPSSILTPCETPFNLTLGYEFEAQYGQAFYRLVAPFATKGAVELTPIESGGQLLTYTPAMFENGADVITINVTVPLTGASELLSIPITIGDCVDCLGVLDGPAREDLCGVCLGDNTTCAGCDGIPNSGAVIDYCGVCDGGNSSCIDITLSPLHIVNCTTQIIFPLFHEPAATPVVWEITEQAQVGSVYVDHDAGIIWYQNPAHSGFDSFEVMVVSQLNTSITDTQNITILISNCTDCSGTQYGTQIVDLCGVCGGDSRSCLDCAGVPNGGSVVDVCGVCGGDGTSCLDCLGIPNGGTPDACGICGNSDFSICQGEGGGNLTFFIVGVTLTLVLLVAGLYGYSITCVDMVSRGRRHLETFDKTERAVNNKSWLVNETTSADRASAASASRARRRVIENQKTDVEGLTTGTDLWVRSMNAAAERERSARRTKNASENIQLSEDLFDPL